VLENEKVESCPHTVDFATPLPPVRLRSRTPPGRRGSTLQSIAGIFHSGDHRRPSRLNHALRKSSLYAVYEKAKVKGIELQRARWAQILFEYTFYLVLILVLYFVLVGRPLWKGAVWWLHYAVKTDFNVMAGFVVVVALAVL
jgi:hypothetical protein